MEISSEHFHGNLPHSSHLGLFNVVLRRIADLAHPGQLPEHVTAADAKEGEFLPFQDGGHDDGGEADPGVLAPGDPADGLGSNDLDGGNLGPGGLGIPNVMMVAR